MDSDFDYIDIRTVKGYRILSSKKCIIGYCHFPGHKGGITKKILEEHECLKKECTFLEKYEDNPYWSALEKMQAAKKERRNYVRSIKAEKAAMQKQSEAIEGIYYEIVLCIIDELGYDMKVLSIKKVHNMRKFILVYISKNPYNDWYQFLDVARAFGKKTGCFLELRHAKNIDGSYVIY